MPFVQIQLPRLFCLFMLDVYVMDFQVYHACLLLVCLWINTAGVFFAFKCLDTEMHILFRIPPKQNVEICNRKNAKRSLLTNVWFFSPVKCQGEKNTWEWKQLWLNFFCLTCGALTSLWSLGPLECWRWIYTISTILLQQNRLIWNGSLISLGGRMWWWGSARQLHAA